MMDPFLAASVKHNFASLNDVASYLKSQCPWWTGSADQDVAVAILHVFHELAWSDRTLHRRECALFDAILEEDRARSNAVRDAVNAHSGLEDENGVLVPACLSVAAAFDAMHRTHLRQVMISHLENVGYLVMMADEDVAPEEVDRFSSYFGSLRHALGVEPLEEMK